MLTAKKYDKLLKALTPCDQPHDVIKSITLTESKNNFGIKIYYINITPKVPIAFEGIASCRKGYKSDCLDSICVRITKISPIIREMFKVFHSTLISQYPQYKEFSYKQNAFDSNNQLVIYDKINNRFEPFKGALYIEGNLFPFNCTLSDSIKLNFKIIGTPAFGDDADQFEFDAQYDINGNQI